MPHRWKDFRQMFRADPHYTRIMDDSLGAWEPPSQCTPLPPIPLKITCQEMGLDPQTTYDGSLAQVARRLRSKGETNQMIARKNSAHHWFHD